MSNFPNGFRNGLSVRQIPLAVAPPNQVFWVSNFASTLLNTKGGSDNNAGTFNEPFATLQYAVSRCKAGAGDIIYIKAGHAETLTGASALAINVKGVDIRGLGNGLERPTFTLATTATTIALSANDVKLDNIVLVPGVDQVVSGLVITGSDATINIETQDGASNVEFVKAITASALAPRLDLRARHKGFVAGTHMTDYIRLVGVAGARIEVDFYGNASTAVVNFSTTLCSDVFVSGNIANGTTATSKDVVDTITGSLWEADLYDAIAGTKVIGGSGSALAQVASSAGSPVSLVSGIKVIPQTATTPGTTIFTVTGGPIRIDYLAAEVTTVIGSGALTAQYATVDTASSTTTTISGATGGSLAATAVGSVITLDPVALSTAPVVVVAGASLGNPAAGNASLGGIIVYPGTVSMITNGSNTGNIKHRLRYIPLAPTSSVAMA